METLLHIKITIL